MRSVIICPDIELSDHLVSVLGELGMTQVVRNLDRYPDAADLQRLMRTTAPQLVFIGMQEPERALPMVQELEAQIPGLQFIAVARVCDPQILLDAMRSGIREFLSSPLDRQNVIDALTRVREMIEKRPVTIASTDNLFCFLPSKPGVGTSTIAVNASVALAKLPETNVLLTDLDLNSGLVRFMLKLANDYSVVDAAEHVLNMDENLWPQLVTSLGRLDVLHAGKLNPNQRIDPGMLRELIDFSRRNYKVICVDLSGNLEKFSLDLMHDCKRIFLVCTPEIPSLHLAREKYLFLKNIDLGARVSVLLNRCTKRQVISVEQIESLLGLPVAMTLPNDYSGVHQSLTAGKAVDSNSELGKQYAALGRMMMGIPEAAKDKASKKGLLDMLSFSSPKLAPSKK